MFTKLQELHIQETGNQLLDNSEAQSSTSIFNKDWWYGNMMDWSMQKPEFKTKMFRFVDVFPYLKTGEEIIKHLKEYFEEEGKLPPLFQWGLGVGKLAPNILAAGLNKNMTSMSKMFITGSTSEDVLKYLNKARQSSLGFTIDLLGEATLSKEEASVYKKRYEELIINLSKASQSWSKNAILDSNEKGDIPSVNVSIKMTALYSQIKLEAWEESLTAIKDTLRPMFLLAKKHFVFINLDMEQYEYKNLSIQAFKELLSEEDFKDYPHFGIVIQAYLKDSLNDLHDLQQWVKKTRKTPVTIRLVKGAYWDFEVITSSQENWPCPVYTNKSETDSNYENCTNFLLQSYPHLYLALASHNVRSISTAITLAKEYKVPQKAIEIQMLYGMGEPIKSNLIKDNYRLREYTTVGDPIPGMAYLVRRLLENSSNEGFIKAKFIDKTDTSLLLQSPHLLEKKENKKNTAHFVNTPLIDFSLATSRSQLQSAIDKLENKLSSSLFNKETGLNAFSVINGEEYKTNNVFIRNNPSNKKQTITKVHLADVDLAEKAIQVSKDFSNQWQNTDAKKRSAMLKQLAVLLKKERFRLSAYIILEVGKTWREADGDVAEAIDFCLYYADLILHTKVDVSNVAGESSIYDFQAKGLCAVIAPWNFPLAILTGMSVAALVTGNTVIMKPAEQSSGIAYELVQLMLQAGFPKAAIHLLCGTGENIGEYLVQHKDVRQIAFTGSKEVGVNILQKSNTYKPKQSYNKSCVIEMGGKNALIIDSDADLDQAIQAVIKSAFGFQGQKCSACSRIIILNSIYDQFVQRLIPAVNSLVVREAKDPKAFAGPVVDQQAYDKIMGFINRAEQRKIPNLLKYNLEKQKFAENYKQGFFVPFCIFGPVDSQDELCQEEIFGPVLSLIKVNSLEEAISTANATSFALTGGIFSRSPANIEKAKKELQVGNLYINRDITGALVGRHPFGGFKMSGLGSKAGSPDYLKEFMNPVCVTENLVRQGFSPDLL
ncbi:MAG: bifunctional proline dehydrogenase/L-glutamate gamma-semialdehyde dehydrogenase [Bdellovibrionaceae bacterium]|nr:bifunctional proline dehydrogenase/L-glutamate gamma-semialdehyde dehydrogenase [Pseudobdellovibrionaceae bacterium]